MMGGGVSLCTLGEEGPLVRPSSLLRGQNSMWEASKFVPPSRTLLRLTQAPDHMSRGTGPTAGETLPGLLWLMQEQFLYLFFVLLVSASIGGYESG